MRRLRHAHSQFFGHQRDGILGAARCNLFDTRLAVNTQTQLCHAFGDAILFQGTRNRAGIKRHTDRAGRFDHTLCGEGAGLKVGPVFGHRSCDFVNKQRARNPPRLWQIRQGHIVVNDHHRHFVPKGPCPFGGQTEIEAVAGIVFDDQQTARRTCHRQNASEDSIDRRRGKNVTAYRGRQHTFPDKTCVRRFMTRAAARHQGNLGLVPIRPDNNTNVRIAIKAGQLAPSRGDRSINGLSDHILFGVGKMFHVALPQATRSPEASK